MYIIITEEDALGFFSRRNFPLSCLLPLRESFLSLIDQLVTFTPNAFFSPVLDLSFSPTRTLNLNFVLSPPPSGHPSWPGDQGAGTTR